MLDMILSVYLVVMFATLWLLYAFRYKLVTKVLARAYRDPYTHLEGYMLRWWFLRKREWKWLERWPRLGYLFCLSVRVHNILRSDNDRHAHDHPFWTISVILRGSYWEWMPAKDRRGFKIAATRHSDFFDAEVLLPVLRSPGDIVVRRSTDRHRLEVEDGPVTTMFVCGPRTQDWGFYVPNVGKLFWRNYLNDWKSA